MIAAAMREAALDYWDRGWSVFPVRGKHPMVSWDAYQTNRAERFQVQQWWAEGSGAGIGVALGRVSNLVRVDADGDAAVEELRRVAGELPFTAEFTTPGGGRGWLFRYAESCATCKLWIGEGQHQELRFMSDGSYTVLPPSPHPSGGTYAWIRELPIADLPQPLYDAVYTRYAEKVLSALEAELKIGDAPDKELVLEALEHLSADRAADYDSWLKVGMCLRSVGEDLLPAWDAWSRKYPGKYEPGACEKKWVTFCPSGNLTGRSILHWAKEDGWSPPRFSLTDVGNSERFVKLHKADMLFCHPWSKWLVWDGARWAEDRAGLAMGSAVEAAKALFDEAAAAFAKAVDAARVSDKDGAQNRRKRASKLYSHAMKSQELRRIEAMLRLSQSPLAVLPEQLDKSTMVLNCPNGTLDLESFFLMPHCKDMLLTKLCPTPYVASAQCPRWEQFLSEVFAEDADILRWMQKLFGYCLTGSVREHVLPIFHGTGSNGKSTLLNVVFHVLGGDFAAKAPSDLFVSRKGGAHPTDMSTMYGKRFVAAIETDEGGKLNEALIKDLTGGDRVTCRRLYEDFWSYEPTHKLVLATNHMPQIQGTDRAIWRRVKRVPFNVTFEGRDDKKLKRKLLAEAEGILRWMVDGCRMWQAEGLGDPKAVQEATQEYRTDSDRLGAFLVELFTQGAGFKVRRTKLREKYKGWCILNRERELSGDAFARAMEERGFGRDTNNFYGLKEKLDEQPR